MKQLLLLIALMLMASSGLQAQKDQDNDTLLWNGHRYAVAVDRNVPSPVQVYYQRTGAQLPFQHWSTNNNRGHVATYEFLDDGIFLSAIEAKRFKTRSGNLWAESGIDTVVSPDYFGIKSLDSARSFDDRLVLADWFSGVLELVFLPSNKQEAKSDETKGHRFLLVVEGRVRENMLVTFDEMRRMEKDAFSLPDKRAMLQRYDRYNNFFLRCALDRERVVFQGHHGLFEHKANGQTLVMEGFGNDALRWPYNWMTATEQTGAPFGDWLLRNDSLFVTAITTHRGSELYSFDSAFVPLGVASPDSMPSSHELFADWLNGDYVIHYGTWVSNNFGVPDYLVAKSQKLRVVNGVAVTSSFSPSSFEEDAKALVASSFTVCNPDNVWSVDDKSLAEAVGKFKAPKKAPAYKGDKMGMRTWFASRPLTDERAKDRLFRVRIGFMVNCKGEAGQWMLLSKGKGELFEFGNMVLDIARSMPQKWLPAEDKKGNAVDCWQVLEFTVSNGVLTNGDYK